MKKILNYLINPPFFVTKKRTTYFMEKFLDQYEERPIILNIGSKERIVSKNIVNLDIINYNGINVQADTHSLPFKRNCVEGVMITGVLEIIQKPDRVLDEIHRILKPNGYLLATFPFMQPYHPDPTDCYRFTYEGVKFLLKKFDIMDLDCNSGLFAMYFWVTRDFIANILSFNNRFLWRINNVLWSWILSPIVLFDHITPRFKWEKNIASSFIALAQKK